MATVYDPMPQPAPRSGIVGFVEDHIVISGILLIAVGILVAYLFSKLKNASGSSTAANANQQPQTLFVPTSNTFETINDITGASGTAASGGIPAAAGFNPPQPEPGGAVSAGVPVEGLPVSPDGGVSSGGFNPPQPGPGGGIIPPISVLPPQPGPGGGSLPPSGTLPPQPGPGGGSSGGFNPPQPIGSGGTLALLRARRAKDPMKGLPIRSLPSHTAPPVSYASPGTSIGLANAAPVEGWYLVDHLGTGGYLDALDVVGLA